MKPTSASAVVKIPPLQRRSDDATAINTIFLCANAFLGDTKSIELYALNEIVLSG
jgi:transcriptional regulator of acetoin/glycerol metabolism